jgi:hypothetical protein
MEMIQGILIRRSIIHYAPQEITKAQLEQFKKERIHSNQW